MILVGFPEACLLLARVPLGPVGGTIAATALGLAGITGGIAAAVQLARALSSKKWPSVEGIIVSSDAKEEGDAGREYYRAYVWYRYVVNDTPYTNDKISFHEVYTPFPGPAEKVAGKHATQTKALVYYNPRKPGMSVLEPGATWLNYLLAAILGSVGVICAIGLGHFWWKEVLGL